MGILDKDLNPLRIQLGEIVKQQHQLAVAVHDESLSNTVSELRETLSEPFLFVIVGEVKAGKSSFINALLATGEEVVAVAPDPCTDTIQQVLYGENADTIVVNPYLKKIYQPVDILKEISVVDTPGTNTISAHHQEITERFVPRSDLIVFVFEAKNPYRQSAWDFFDYIHAEWRKKIIFVLQQADLMNEDDLQVNIEGVRKNAVKKGIEVPQVFAVSAKLEQEGAHEVSGFGPLNTYIRDNITGKNAFKLKLESSLDTADTVQDRIMAKIQLMEDQLKKDRDFRAEILNTLRDQEDRSNRQVDTLIANLLNEYDRVTGKTYNDLSNGLNFAKLTSKSFRSIFNKKESPKVWLEDLAKALDNELSRGFQHKLSEGVEEIADSISQMAKIINLKIQNNQAILRGGEDIFGEISDRRRAVLRDLQDDFQKFMTRTENFVGEELFPQASSFSPNIAAGGGMAVIGAVLAAVTQMTVLDVTGGILSAVGLLFAGGTVVLKRGRILKGFDQEIKKSREDLKLELDLKLKSYVSHIRQKIDHNFTEFDVVLEAQTQHLQGIASQYENIQTELSMVRESLGH